MKFNFEATGVGSVPFKDEKIACRLIFNTFKEIPFWPQLPKRSYLENMYAQFSQSMPGLVLDEAAKSIHIDTSRVAAEIENVYSKYLEGDLEFFKISEDYAKGFYEFLECLKGCPKGLKFVKGQITGPVSYALSVTDQNKKAVIYDKDLYEILTKILSMKARWQIKKIKKYFPNVIIFLDEPYLVSIGSSFVNIDIEEAVRKLDELIDSIKKDGALVGIHCCGNTDWSMLLKRDIDILSFDAYNFTKELALYAPDVKNFLKRGGTIAWGVVPSSDEIEGQTDAMLVEKLKSCISILNSKGIDSKDISSLVTPSCGVGTLEESKAKKVLNHTKILSEYIRRREDE